MSYSNPWPCTKDEEGEQDDYVTFRAAMDEFKMADGKW